MSGKHSAVIFIFAIAIALAALRAEDAGGPTVTMGASMAAVDPARRPQFAVNGAKSKKLPLERTQAPPHKHTAKLSGPLTTTIELVGTAPAAGDIFVLKGSLVSASPASDVEFKWILPEGVELVNGEVSGVVASLTPDKPFEVQLTLRQISAENAQVHLQALGAAGGGRYGHTSQYNTLTEQLLQSSRKELLKSTQEHAEKHQPKVVH